jgi:hypothetical protein
MKIGLFFIIVLLALLHPIIPFAHEVKGVKDLGIMQQTSLLQKVSTSAVNISLNDDLLDINDDEINDTERRSLSFQKSSYKTLFYVTSYAHLGTFNRDWNSSNSSHSQSSLFILHRVLRI